VEQSFCVIILRSFLLAIEFERRILHQSPPVYTAQHSSTIARLWRCCHQSQYSKHQQQSKYSICYCTAIVHIMKTRLCHATSYLDYPAARRKIANTLI